MAIFWGVFRPNVAGAPKKNSPRARDAHARDDFWRSILGCRIFGLGMPLPLSIRARIVNVCL